MLKKSILIFLCMFLNQALRPMEDFPEPVPLTRSAKTMAPVRKREWKTEFGTTAPEISESMSKMDITKKWETAFEQQRAQQQVAQTMLFNAVKNDDLPALKQIALTSNLLFLKDKKGNNALHAILMRQSSEKRNETGRYLIYLNPKLLFARNKEGISPLEKMLESEADFDAFIKPLLLLTESA